MDIENLKRLVAQYQNSMAYYKDTKNAYNEQSCRDEYISPLLECFGWDVTNKKGVLPQYREVIVEKFSNRLERPDYTLTLNGVSKLFVEAKKPGVAIEVQDEPALQARRYGWNAKHRLSILTNFEYLLIYDTTRKPEEGDKVRTSLYRKYYFEEYVGKYEEIFKLISRKSVYDGTYDAFVESEFADKDRYHAEIDDEFLKLMNGWRLELGRYLYRKEERYRNLAILNDSVQAFINQIIFLRICEDRNLPLYQNLRNAAKDKKELQRMLLKVFQETDKRYNSGLFQGDNVIFDLSSDIIYEIVMSLYYPKSPYLFDMIEPGILGKIYEAFLTEGLIENNGAVELAKKKTYKYKSVVSTPQEIVKYMVKNTLDEKCSGVSPKQILQLKVADIACGSGVFLEEAYQYLVDYCTGWYQEHEPDHLLELENGRKKLPIQDKKELLVNCIYGVDIDVHAVDVSRFSMMLKLMEDETEPSLQGMIPILPNLTANIIHGNSLAEDADLEQIHLTTDELLAIAPLDWTEVNHGQKFDVILGNPPYVKTGDMHALSTETEFELYKKKYKSAYKQFDKYFLFVEKGMGLLKETGKLCYIIPNKFYKIAAGQELRKLTGAHVERLDDFGDLQLFLDKTIYSAIVTLRRQQTEEMIYMPVDSLAELWGGEGREGVSILNRSLSKEPWRLTADIDFMKLMHGLEEKIIPLSRVAEIFNGIQTSAERPEKFSDKKEVYWFDSESVVEENDTNVSIRKYGNVYSIEKSILKPYFKPTKKIEKGMDTYALLETDKRIIFPYDTQGKLIEIETMKTDYPGTYAYLTDCYDRLVPKCLNDGVGRDVPNATEDDWYQYGRTQALTAFINVQKLIVRVLSKEPMYAFDRQDMLIASGGTAGYCAVSEKTDSGYALEYIQAWLTHPYTEKMFQIMGSDFENGFTARGTFLLGKIPFVKLDFSDPAQMQIYQNVVSCTRKIYELNDELKEKRDKAARSVLEKEKSRLIMRVKDFITDIYQQNFR